MKKASTLLVVAIVVCQVFAVLSPSATAYDPKETEFEEFSLMKYYEIFKPEKLPEQTRSSKSSPTMSATTLILEIRENWDKLSSQAQGELEWVLQRPVDASGGWDNNQHLLPKLYTSPDENFVIHWTNGTDGGLAADAPPLTDSDGDDVPDYIENFAEIFDNVWSTEITNPTYGYHQPPSDAAESNENSRNPDDKYDVFVYELNGYAYGYTDPEEKSIIHQHGSSYSYIAVDNDYVGFPGTQMESMQVTAAHEFFHAIQFHYDCGEETWWMETTAVWMEDEVYDPVNDYLQYIPGWLLNPHLSLTLADGSHEYGNCIFAKFLAENQGKDVIKDVWEEMVSGDGITSIDDALSSNYATNFESVFREFTVVNYLNSLNNHDGNFANDQYEEGDLYDDIHHRDMSAPATFSQENPVQEYASEYIEITPPGEIIVSFDGDWLTNFIVRILKIDGSTFAVETMNLNWLKDGSVEISTTHDRIVLVIAREDDLLGDGTYTARLSVRGWTRYGFDQSRTMYYPYPSKYHIPNTAFETLWTSPHEGKNLMALTGDVNGDGKLEVVKVSGDNLKVISGDGVGLWTETIPGTDSYYGTGMLQLNLLQDVTGDGIPEIFVTRKVSHYQSNIYVYDGDQNRIKTLSRSVGRDGNMWAVAVFDVDGDGDKEIFCGIGSNYVGNPRGACLFDYDTGTQLWYYAAGNPVTDCIADLNNDGLLEITSGWWTVHNGANGRGKGSNTYTSDSSVYVVVINENGDEIFTKEIHGTHNHGGAFERIVDLDRDGTKEVIVFHGHEPVYPGYAQIFLLDESGNELDSYTGSYNKAWSGVAIADINEDGKNEVIVGSNDGVLRVMDHDLNVIDSVNHYYGPQAVNDINGDGVLEIIVTDYNTRELVVLDNDLDELWKLSFPVNPSAIVSDVNGDGANDLIIKADRLYVVSSPSRVKLPTPIFTPAIEKIPLRFTTEPLAGTWGPGTNVQVEIHDISPRAWQSLTDLDLKPEDVFVASFDCNAFRNRDANPELSREEIMQNVYEAIPQTVIDELYSYMSEMFVVYSVISTFASLFADFGMEIIEGSPLSTADAFAVLTFAIPESLEEEDWVPTYVYSKYGYLDEGAWSTLGAGFGTGDLNTVSVYCFADLLIIDSLGRTISKELNEIPGAAYFESDLNQDGETDDTVILPEIPGVEYTIWVLPEPTAPPEETFTLVLGSIDIGIPIAEDVPLSEAPENGYELTSLFSPQEAPPITTLTVGDPQFINANGDLFVRLTTPLTLSANPGSAEVSTTAYRVYNTTYDSGLISCTTPETFYLTELNDGMYSVDYYSVDVTGNIEPTNTLTMILDNTGPLITVSNPPAGWALQDGVTFIGSIVDPESGVSSMSFSIREANGGEGIPIGFEDLAVSYDSITGDWSLSFDTLLVPDGYYVLHIEAEDNLGNEASTTVPYSIRNWAVIELLPSTEDNKAGRTMPVKFALRVAVEVDPDQPFVYNEELRIEIFATADPDNVLQESHYGDTSRDYRISNVLYITNFKTIRRTPMEYTVAIYRDSFDVGSFTFETVK